MNKRRHKIYRYLNTSYQSMLDKEALLLKDMQAGLLDQCLHMYQCSGQTLVLPSGKKWQDSVDVKHALSNIGWQLLQRRSGGAPVPQTSGLINLSHLYHWQHDEPYSVKLAYQHFCEVLTIFFRNFGLDAQAHATPFSYCDGDYNLNINGQKIVGTAQRVVNRKGGGKIVMAQACILIDGDVDTLVEPVNLINKLHNMNEHVRGDAHTCLHAHVDKLPHMDKLFNMIIDAFVRSEIYRPNSNQHLVSQNVD